MNKDPKSGQDILAFFTYTLFLLVFKDDKLKNVLENAKLRSRGSSPILTDGEVITMFMIGEYLGLGSDKKIWTYFKRYWQSWISGLDCRASFSSQGANLWALKRKIQEM